MKDVSGFKLENPAGSFEMEKMADGEWRLVSPSRKMDLDRVEIESLPRFPRRSDALPRRLQAPPSSARIHQYRTELVLYPSARPRQPG